MLPLLLPLLLLLPAAAAAAAATAARCSLLAAATAAPAAATAAAPAAAAMLVPAAAAAAAAAAATAAATLAAASVPWLLLLLPKWPQNQGKIAPKRIPKNCQAKAYQLTVFSNDLKPANQQQISATHRNSAATQLQLSRIENYGFRALELHISGSELHPATHCNSEPCDSEKTV